MKRTLLSSVYTILSPIQGNAANMNLRMGDTVWNMWFQARTTNSAVPDFTAESFICIYWRASVSPGISAVLPQRSYGRRPSCSCIMQPFRCQYAETFAGYRGRLELKIVQNRIWNPDIPLQNSRLLIDFPFGIAYNFIVIFCGSRCSCPAQGIPGKKNTNCL